MFICEDGILIAETIENAIVKTGGKRIYYDKNAGVATLFTKSGGKDVWVVLNDFLSTIIGKETLDKILPHIAKKTDITKDKPNLEFYKFIRRAEIFGII